MRVGLVGSALAVLLGIRGTNATAGCYQSTGANKGLKKATPDGPCAPGCKEAFMRLHDQTFYDYHQTSFTETSLGVCVTKVGVSGKAMEEISGLAVGGKAPPTVKCDGNTLMTPAVFEDNDHWAKNQAYHIGWCNGATGNGAKSALQTNGKRTTPPQKDGGTITKGARGDCGVVQKLVFPAGNMWLEYKPEFYGQSPDDNIPDSKGTCVGGMFLPFVPGEFMWGRGAHIVIFALLLIWSFLGVAIIADVFMAAIEVITSKKKTMVVMQTDSAGVKKKVEVEYLVWNETVANLTLMALGSSAPEILLSVLETMGTLEKSTSPGGLGPGTIVGSAAFNLLAILSICVVAIPKGEDRKIKNLETHTVSAIYSVFAYVWLFLCVKDNAITIVEAVITFLLFPILVAHVYFTEKRGWMLKGRSEKIAPEGHVAGTSGLGASGYGSSMTLEQKMAKTNAASALRGLLLSDATPEEKEKQKQAVAAAMKAELTTDQRVSRAKYRANAIRSMGGKQRVIAAPVGDETKEAVAGLAKDASDAKLRAAKDAEVDPTLARIYFNSPNVAVFENDGEVKLQVVREGNMEGNVTVWFVTSDGTALAGEDYVHTRGEVTFAPNEAMKTITIKLIDDTEYEPDEIFFVKLKIPESGRKGVSGETGQQIMNGTCTVVILNDDTPGRFQFKESQVACQESDGTVDVTITRDNGSSGEITVSYKTMDGTAMAGDDYESVSGELVFGNMETSKTISIKLITSDEYEREEHFTVEFELKGAPDDGSSYGDHRVCVVNVAGDAQVAELTDLIASMVRADMEAMDLGTTSWAGQFKDAMSVGGDDDEGGKPSFINHFMHMLSFFWKILFALVPPTSYGGGWWTFFIALAFIGVLTGFIADIAGIFGCLIGLPDTITAITFVALGTSLPDTFASKSAAVNDEWADASIGNVTGSNSVNVFLGLGLPWLIATISHSASGFFPTILDGDGNVDMKLGKSLKKGNYAMISGDLGVSVVIFCCCACTCIGVLYARRFMGLGELGGPEGSKKVTGAIFLGLWLTYVIISSLQATGGIYISI
jgi:solute carrier family 8 (sodium/calcium exchanger)